MVVEVSALMAAYVKSLKVVNDIAKRGVKLMSEYANKIKTDSNHHQDLL